MTNARRRTRRDGITGELKYLTLARELTADPQMCILIANACSMDRARERGQAISSLDYTLSVS